MKLRDYIQKEKKEKIINDEKAREELMNLNLEKEAFRADFTHYVLDKIRNKIEQLSYNITEFSAKEIEYNLKKLPFVLSFDIEVEIDRQIAQYFLEITGNFNLYKEGIMFKFESIGYSKTLEIEKIPFKDLENFDIEEYLTKSMLKFKNNE